jgi:hypothetical protein
VSGLRARLLLAVALALGIGLMVPFEETVTRVAGVACLFAFIVGGVFVIAEPDFLADDDSADR